MDDHDVPQWLNDEERQMWATVSGVAALNAAPGFDDALGGKLLRMLRALALARSVIARAREHSCEMSAPIGDEHGGGYMRGTEVHHLRSLVSVLASDDAMIALGRKVADDE